MKDVVVSTMPIKLYKNIIVIAPLLLMPFLAIK